MVKTKLIKKAIETGKKIAGKAKEVGKKIINALNPSTKEDIRKAFKRANQRIAEIAKQFKDYGGTESAIYKNEVAKFQKGSYAPYMSESASGNVKFDIPKILHAFETGELSQSEFNEILASASGQQYVPESGELVESNKTAGIKTISDLKERTLQSVPEEFDEKTEDWKEYAEDFANISQNFQTEYEDFKKKYKTVAKRKEAAPGLFQEGKKSYSELSDLTSDMKKAIKLFKKEKDAAKTANDKLKEPRKTKTERK